MDTKIKNFLQSVRSRRIIAGIGLFAAALFIFEAGVFVGYHKAAFSFQWGHDYYQTFGERGRGLPGFGMMDPTEAHGTAGRILSINLPAILVEDRDNVEKTVLVASTTEIRRFRNSIPSSDLRVNDFVIVIGAPNTQGEIQAQLIRLMPPMPSIPQPAANQIP